MKNSVTDSIVIIENEMTSCLNFELFDKQKSVEPYTWSWLALKLAEGALAYVGGEIAKGIFGGLFKKQNNIEKLLENFMRNLLLSIQQIIHEEKIREYNGIFKSVLKDLALYGNDSKKSA